MIAEQTINIHFVKAALHGVKQKQLDTLSLLLQANINPVLLDYDKSRVTFNQYMHLLRQIWLITQDEFLGFAPCPRRLGAFAIMCRLIIHCKTLGEALQQAYEFFRLFDDEWLIKPERDEYSAHFCVSIPKHYDPAHYITEHMILVWRGLACWLVDQQLHVDRLQFSYPQPLHSDEYRFYFEASILQFNASATQFSFPLHYLDLPIVQTVATLADFLPNAPTYFLTQFRNHRPFTYRIRQILKQQIDQEPPILESIAEQLNLTSQTLRRRLESEGKTYQTIKDELRRDAAIHLLLSSTMVLPGHKNKSQLSLDEIADRLGFSESSTFQRAFKKWTGVHPKIYRALQG